MDRENRVSRMLRGDRSLEFYNGQFLYVTREGASEKFKFLSAASVTAAFRNAPTDSGWLPSGVVRCGGTVHGDFAVLFIPARVHQLAVELGPRNRVLKLSLPLPSLVIFGMAKAYRLWAMKETAFSPNATLFRCPTPNVFSDGRICWGDNKPPRASAATIAKAWDLFITSAFSGHAAEGKSRTYPKDVRDLFGKLLRKRKFPPRELILAGGSANAIINRTIGENNAD